MHLCLFTAALMLVMIPLSLDEVVALVQFVVRRRREGVSAWRTFWLGGDLPDGTPTWKPTRPERWRPSGMLWGVTGTWPLYLSVALGIWLMFAPAAFGSRGAMADSDHLVGALVIVFAGVATAEVGRPARFLNVPLGARLLVAPWLLDGGTALARWDGAVIGFLVLAVALPLGRIRDHYGSFDPYVAWRPFGRYPASHTA